MACLSAGERHWVIKVIIMRRLALTLLALPQACPDGKEIEAWFQAKLDASDNGHKKAEKRHKGCEARLQAKLDASEAERKEANRALKEALIPNLHGQLQRGSHPASSGPVVTRTNTERHTFSVGVGMTPTGPTGSLAYNHETGAS